MLIDRADENVARSPGRAAYSLLWTIVRCTADVLLQVQARRIELAARADIERLLANDAHLLRDLGLLGCKAELAERPSRACHARRAGEAPPCL